ncbi:MAG: acyl carrier protein [Actinomycetota bacterium]|nr:acyl carrier protein [Actinomycetota bacterium]
MDLTGAIRDVLGAEGRLGVPVEEIGDEDDLYKRGLTSHASVRLMLALEDHFSVEFPDALLTKATFESIGSIRRAIEGLGLAGGPASNGG